MCWTCISVSGSCSLISFASLHKFDCFLAHLLITHHTHCSRVTERVEPNLISVYMGADPSLSCWFRVRARFSSDSALCDSLISCFAYGFDLCDHPVLNFSFSEWVDLCDPHTFELFRRNYLCDLSLSELSANWTFLRGFVSEKTSHFVIPLWNLEERLSFEPFVCRSCEYWSICVLSIDLRLSISCVVSIWIVE